MCVSSSCLEYEVISTTSGPNGEEVSILTTNQTHTAVENLKPESRYVSNPGQVGSIYWEPVTSHQTKKTSIKSVRE